MRWLAVAIVLTACTSTPTRSLGELRSKEVSLSWSSARDEPDQLEVYVQLDYAVDECVAVDATAILDGQPLDVVTRGYGGEDQHGGTYCERPAWIMTVPAGGDPAATVTLEIADDSGRITFELANPFAARSAQASTSGTTAVWSGYCSDPDRPIGPMGELGLAPDQEMSLSWSPATDLIQDPTLTAYTASGDWLFTLGEADITVDGPEIRFVAPAESADAARVLVDGSYSPPVQRCDGAEACQATVLFCSEASVTVP